MPAQVLILYHSRHGSVQLLAEKIAIGVQSAGAEALLRTVAAITPNPVHSPAHPVVSKAELIQANAIAIGSPVRFGQMSVEMKYFWEQTTDLWLQGALIDKPAGVFTASSSMHGGQEANLLGMMLPLLHHGMVLLGQPYDAPALHQTQSGGTPYGPTHVSTHAGSQQQGPQLSNHESILCLEFGKRLARFAGKLQ
ncbi:NAD(P)H:quinone oxidoreductase [Rheinheimera tilapiae]|uniref:NAD(P)H:quinone oxidoreductase n=1 Tax=Rheinheimera tilapiae TaxID=875043 RepID=A0ABV6BIW6_9GAMM